MSLTHNSPIPLQYPVDAYNDDLKLAHGVKHKEISFAGLVRKIVFVLNDRTGEQVEWCFWGFTERTIFYSRMKRSNISPLYNEGEMTAKAYRSLTFPAAD